MTGQIAFARTLRALDSENARGSKLALIAAVLLLAAWLWWFFTPSIVDERASRNRPAAARQDSSQTIQISPATVVRRALSR